MRGKEKERKRDGKTKLERNNYRDKEKQFSTKALIFFSGYQNPSHGPGTKAQERRKRRKKFKTSLMNLLDA